LVAGATVGLGFGLQEIFANFVSGLIVLFEQPIRVGDIVTIGDVTGVVSKIRMRATTVTNWDRQEFIVPNREFITGRLLNWTLSSTVNRVVITAGVAYGSDPDRVKEILLEIANEHPVVLSDPEPSVTFEQFGDSTLNIVLRCYLPTMDGRLATIHELNTAVHERLNEAGIEFAFPTRELYFKNPLLPPQTDQPTDQATNQATDTSAKHVDR
jgi:potassium efflux system protein